MTGLVRKATFFVACAMLLGAAASFAGIVSPGNCSITRSENGATATRINLVGYNSTAAASGTASDSLEVNSKIVVTVRDIALNAIAGVPVVLDFSACTGGAGEIKVSGTQYFHGQTAGCATATIQNYSTTNGTVTFNVVGGRSGATLHALGCVKVYADSYLLGSLNVGTFDQTNSGGMTLADVAFFWSDLGAPASPLRDRSDMDGNGSLTLADVAYAWTANGHASSFNASGTPVCP